MSKKINATQRVRAWLGLFIVGLVVSGITAGPIQSELGWLESVLRDGMFKQTAQATGLLPWIERVHGAVRATNGAYPYLAYGTDWLVFAHLVIAIAFIGPWIDPLRNKWVIQFGLIACAAVIPWALITGGIRGIPLPWRLIDCNFGVVGSIPLAISMRWIRRLEGSAGHV